MSACFFNLDPLSHASLQEMQFFQKGCSSRESRAGACLPDKEDPDSQSVLNFRESEVFKKGQVNIAEVNTVQEVDQVHHPDEGKDPQVHLPQKSHFLC